VAGAGDSRRWWATVRPAASDSSAPPFQSRWVQSPSAAGVARRRGGAVPADGGVSENPFELASHQPAEQQHRLTQQRLGGVMHGFQRSAWPGIEGKGNPAQSPCRAGSCRLQQGRLSCKERRRFAGCGGSPCHRPSPHRGGARVFGRQLQGPGQGQAPNDAVPRRSLPRCSRFIAGPAIAGTRQIGPDRLGSSHRSWVEALVGEGH